MYASDNEVLLDNIRQGVIVKDNNETRVLLDSLNCAQFLMIIHLMGGHSKEGEVASKPLQPLWSRLPSPVIYEVMLVVSKPDGA